MFKAGQKKLIAIKNPSLISLPNVNTRVISRTKPCFVKSYQASRRFQFPSVSKIWDRHESNSIRIFGNSIITHENPMFFKRLFSSLSSTTEAKAKADDQINVHQTSGEEEYQEALRVLNSDENTAKGLFEKAAALGHADAQYRVSFWIDKKYWLEKAAKQNHLQAQIALALWYFEFDSKTDGLQWLIKAAEQGDPEAQIEVAWWHLNGWGTPVDDNEALKWMQKAESLKTPVADYFVYRFFLEDMAPVLEKKIIQMESKLKELESSGKDEAAITELRRTLHNDKFYLNTETERAWIMLKWAAQKDMPEACIFLAQQYFTAKNDWHTASKWMFRASLLGSEEAQRTMSEWRRNPKYWVIKVVGVVKDFVKGTYGMLSIVLFLLWGVSSQIGEWLSKHIQRLKK